MISAELVMKIGRNIDKVAAALQTAGRYEAAVLVEFASMEEQRVTPLPQAVGRITPYFSIIVVHGQGRRP